MGTFCAKKLSLVVANNCMDFTQMIWAAPIYFIGAGGTALATASEANVTVSGSALAGNPTGIFGMSGSLTYTGDQIDIYAEFHVTGMTQSFSNGFFLTFFFDGVKIGFCSISNPPTGSEFRIQDFDHPNPAGTLIPSSVPGLFMLHFRIPASVAKVFKVEDDGVGDTWAQLVDGGINTSMAYTMVLHC